MAAKKKRVKYTDDFPAQWEEEFAKHHTITHTCLAIGISDETYRRWYNEKPEFKEAADRAKERNLDYVESALFKRIEGGDTAAIIFALKTLGKRRGYSERQELTGADGQPLMPSIRFGGDLSDEEKEKL